MTNECLRILLIEKVNNKFPFSKVELIKTIWRHGKHPKECQGTCTVLNGPMSTCCITCLWDDY